MRAFFSIILALAVAVGTAEAREPSGTAAAFRMLRCVLLPRRARDLACNFFKLRTF